MAFVNSDPGFTGGSVNLPVRLLDDETNLLDEVLLTRCSVCGGESPILGNSQPGQTSTFTQADPDVGGPLNSGTLSLSHPGIYDDGYFSIEITTGYEVTAVINPVPIPGAVWLFGSAMIGLAGRRRRTA